MDIDLIAKHIPALLAFKDRIEGMIDGADKAKSDAHDTLDELLSFKSEFEAALPDIRKAVADASALVDDVAAIKKDLGPALAWIAEQQKAEEAAKTVKPAEAAHPADPDKPLEHIAEVEAGLDAGKETTEEITG